MSQSEALLVDKLFNAPVGVVWGAWADPAKLAQWWRTDGIAETVITEYDFRPGGTWKQQAILSSGITVGESDPGSVFREIIPHERIVTVPKPMAEESVEVVPDMLETVVSFESVSDNQTRVTVTLVRSKQDDWQPGDAQQAAYTEMFENLARFVES